LLPDLDEFDIDDPKTLAGVKLILDELDEAREAVEALIPRPQK
jgi:hypothetical protein